jgi:hypothetical protein
MSAGIFVHNFALRIPPEASRLAASLSPPWRNFHCKTMHQAGGGPEKRAKDTKPKGFSP